jgi:deoxyribodipyrimidine photolyase
MIPSDWTLEILYEYKLMSNGSIYIKTWVEEYTDLDVDKLNTNWLYTTTYYNKPIIKHRN